MYFPFVEDAPRQELISMIGGICTGTRPPHGSGSLGDFPVYLNERFGGTPRSPYEIFTEQSEGLDIYETGEMIISLIDDFQAIGAASDEVVSQ